MFDMMSDVTLVIHILVNKNIHFRNDNDDQNNKP